MTNEIYLNDENEIVSKDEATHFVVQELDENGLLKKEVFGTTKKPWETPNYNEENVVVSPQLQELLDNCKDKDGNYMFRKK